MKRLLMAPKLIIGAGGAAWWILQGFRRESVKVDGFVVTIPSDTDETCGLPIFPPSTWGSLPKEKKDYVLVIGIMNPKIDTVPIVSLLKSEGFTNILSYTEFLTKLFEESAINCNMLDSKILEANTNSLDEVRDVLYDELSKETLEQFISYTKKFIDDDSLIQLNPYFPEDLPRWPNPMRIIDCGAFDGETVLSAAKRGYEINASVCLEPDSANFELLTSATKNLENHISLPLAVGEYSSSIFFSEQSTTGSRVVEKSSKVVQCISIDEVFSTWKPNLIKMDIEGSELAALKGASSTIKEHRPSMAISVYHNSSDIFNIPLLLKSLLGEDARFYLRRHSRTIADTVLYVFPW